MALLEGERHNINHRWTLDFTGEGARVSAKSSAFSNLRRLLQWFYTLR